MDRGSRCRYGERLATVDVSYCPCDGCICKCSMCGCRCVLGAIIPQPVWHWLQGQIGVGACCSSTSSLRYRPSSQPCRLFTKGIILGYRRGQRKQHPHTSLVQLEGVTNKEHTGFYLGKRLAYVYRAHKRSKAKGNKKPSKYRVIWGKVTRSHGNSGVVRAKFTKNLPPKTFGATVRVVSVAGRVGVGLDHYSNPVGLDRQREAVIVSLQAGQASVLRSIGICMHTQQ